MSLPIHHIPIEEADLRSAELLEAVAERGEIVVFYRDGVPVAEMSPVEPAPTERLPVPNTHKRLPL